MEINPNNRNIPASDEGRTPPPVRRAVPPASSAGDRSASEGIGRNAASHEPGASEGRRIPGTAPRADRTEAAPRRTREIPSQSPERRQPMSDAQSPRRTVPRQNAARGAGAAHRSGGAVRASDHGRKCKTNRAAQHASACGGAHGKRKSRCRAAFRISGKTCAGSGREKRKRRAPQHSPGFGER